MSATGDFILIQAIRHLEKRNNGDISEESEEEDEVASLGEFSTDFLLESAAKFVNAILEADNQPLPFKSVKPHQSMSAKYNFSTKLAEMIRALGYNGDLGYQTFLYGTERELRNVFLFLVDKMPKEHDAATASTEADEWPQWKSKTRAEVCQQVTSLWTPWSLYPTGLRPTQAGTFLRCGIGGCEDFCSCDLCFATNDGKTCFDNLLKETRAASFSMTSSGRLCSSIINYNQSLKVEPDDKKLLTDTLKRIERSTAPDCHTFKEDMLRLTVATIDKTSSTKLQAGEATSSESQPESEDATLLSPEEILLDELRQERDKLQVEVQEIQSSYVSTRNETIRIRKNLQSVKSEVTCLDKEIEENRAQLARFEHIQLLLPESESNKTKLENMIAKNLEKINLLKSQWREHKESLQEEYNRLMTSATEKANRGDAGTKLRRRMSDFEDKLRSKENLRRQYEADVTKIKKSISRSVYTQQLLDTLNKISRQREDTAKLIDDVKTTQKDLNNLNGKLERTFKEAEIKIFQISASDKTLASLYLSLTEIHSEMSSIVEGIRRIGQLKRTTRSNNDQIVSEQSNKSSDRIAKLRQDLDNIRAENEAMKEKIKSFQK